MRKKLSELTDRQRKTLKSTKDKARRERLIYNYQYDANKRAAREIGLIQDPSESIVLTKPKNMAKSTFEKIVSKFQYPINRSFLKVK